MTMPTLIPHSGANGSMNGAVVSAEDGSGQDAALESIRILIVEDDWFVSMEMEHVVETEGYDVVGVATSAEEAVSLAGQRQPDLILMDIRLRGGSDGVEAAIEINRRHGIRCLFCSAHTDPGTLERAQAATPAGWLAKPFSGPQLLEAIAVALDGLGLLD
ncbi:CheY-like chemotaxis protein [Constrictibacter sp. MBR-5]|jgi:CheY-like chemotaxis protein|uniref:response regulator n=1 Tax=Constrictibacter sp. MBR-5 TaxID=3156467 RepID=UPI00339B94E1